jgi:hypothetical protein
MHTWQMGWLQHAVVNNGSADLGGSEDEQARHRADMVTAECNILERFNVEPENPGCIERVSTTS